MAKVYKAFQANMERYVALKVLPAHYADEPQFAKRFIQEARTIARLEHKNILPVYDFGEHNGITYLVMRYLEGGTLKDVLAQGRLTLHDTLEIMDQVCSALGYAHRQDVIHRDVKPANIMIDSEGAVYLTDFGIAKVVGKASDLTATGAAIGTPAYMAPEQTVGEKIDGRTDLYALGVVLYEMVVGRVPFKADTPMAVLMAHLHDPLPLPSQADPQIHAEIENVIIKTLAKDPDDRYQSAEALMQALRQAVYAAAPESLETTLVNLIAEIRAKRSADLTVQGGRIADEISDPHLLEKLEQLYIDGLSAYWVKDWDRAQARLQEVIRVDPNYKDAALRLAEIEKQSQLAELHSQAQTAIEQDSWETAQGILQQILSATPDDREAKEKMAQVEKELELASLYAECEQLSEAGQWQAVINIFERIHQIDREYPDTQDLFVQAQEALVEQQRLETIKVTYQQGLQALDDGNWKQAQKLFTTIKNQQPNYAETEQLLARAADELSSAKTDGEASQTWFKPWYALVGIVGIVAAALVVSVGIWYFFLSSPKPGSQESYALPTSTPEEDRTDAPDEAPPSKDTERGDLDLTSAGVFDDFSAPDGQLDRDRWRVNCDLGHFEDLGGSIENGQLVFLNTIASKPQECFLEALQGESTPGEALGGIAATLGEDYLQGEMGSNIWISFISELEKDKILHAFCGVQSWPGMQLALFAVIDPEDVSLFYNDIEIDPDMSHKFHLEADPNTMAIHCQVDEIPLGVWVPENPEELWQKEFRRLVEIQRAEGTVASSQVNDIRLLPPHPKSPADCPEITAWKAEYWDNTALAGEPVVCRNEGFPLHFWAHGSPAPEIPYDFFSARYTRQLFLDEGHYIFRLSGDDGVRLWLDDEILIDEWQPHSFIDYYAEVDLPAGEYTLKVEYFEEGDEAHLELFALHNDQILFHVEPGCIPPVESLIGWWAGDGNTSNQLGGLAGELLNGASYAPGKMEEAFQFDQTGGEPGTGAAVEIPLTPEYEFLQAFTTEAWVYLDPSNPRQDQIEDFVVLGKKFNLRKEGDGRLHLFIFSNGQLHHLWGEEPLPRGEWIHAVGTFDGRSMHLYQNANLIAEMEVPDSLDPAAYFLLSDTDEPLSGLLDEVSLYDRALTLGEIRMLYFVGGAFGKCK
jgi:tetratricopeptide (TPR) repeat protein